MEHRLQFLHAYRSLLRAASYLPDSLSRVRIHNEIVHQFHKRSSLKLNPKTSHLTLRQLNTRISNLQKAVDLHSSHLLNVLKFTYGRKGTRRRVLMSQLLSSPETDTLPDSGSLEEFIQTSLKPARNGHGDNSKLAALLRSQKEHTAHEDSLKLKEINPSIPKENIWGRSTPVKVRKNKETRWWAKTLKKVCPPLEREEWDRLRKLASGELPFDVPQRRNSQGVHEEGATAVNLISLLGDRLPRVKGSVEQRELLNRRGLRRLYSLVWSHTPTMAFDDATKSWIVDWGREPSQSKSGVKAIPRASIRHSELFSGINDLRTSSKSKSKSKSGAGKSTEKERRIQGRYKEAIS